jgi:hypothetical protein
MNKYYFIYLTWLLPLYFLFQASYQIATMQGINNTYSNGNSYMADVTDFDVKQIAAQTNGYVVLKFSTTDGEIVERKLTLPVQMAQVIMESELIPVRYLESSFNPIVMMPTFELQKKVVRVNLGVTGFGLVVTVIIAIFASRYARRRIRDGEETLVFERIDSDSKEVTE